MRQVQQPPAWQLKRALATGQAKEQCCATSAALLEPPFAGLAVAFIQRLAMQTRISTGTRDV